MEVENATRIAVVGKPGSGCSSLANSILGEKHFEINSSSVSRSGSSLSKTTSVHGRRLTLIDTTGLFLLGVSEEDREASTLSCMAECAPGVNALVIVFKVEKFTEEEDAIFKQICQLFSEDVLKYATVVFTRGDQLPDGVTIRDFVGDNRALTEWVAKCGGRCHVLDNRHWNQDQQDPYRSNRVHMAGLLETIDEIVAAHGGRRYTNEKLQKMEGDIEREQKLTTPSAEASATEMREQAKRRVIKKRMGTSRFIRLVVRFLKGGAVVVVTLAVILSAYTRGWNLLWTN